MSKVVFITGTGHCGSTLLDLMLGSHPAGFSLGEFHRTRPRLQCRECDVCPFWSRIPAWWLHLHFGKGRRIGRFFDPYPRLLDTSGASFLVDSSKNTRWISSHKRNGDYLILLERDPKAVVASYFRKYPERGFESIADSIVRSQRRLRDYHAQYAGDKSIVHYEELVEQPEQALRALCRSIGISFEPQMLCPFEQEHHIIAGNGMTRRLGRGNQGDGFYRSSAIRLDERWRQELTDEQINYIEDRVGIADPAPA